MWGKPDTGWLTVQGFLAREPPQGTGNPGGKVDGLATVFCICIDLWVEGA